MPTNSWSEWQNCVLSKLDAHGQSIKDNGAALEKTNEAIVEIRIAIAKLKTSARIWGLLAGSIGAAALIYIQGMF